jgi:hypothetical protein
MKMKNTINSIVLFTSFFAMGQKYEPVVSTYDNYIPLVSSSNTWSILTNATAGGGSLNSFYVKVGDTAMIKGKEYQKVFISYDSIGLEDNWNQIGYMFEDFQSQQCYFQNMESQEGLIYDFSSGIGDTVNVWNTYAQFYFPVSAKVIDKDSILLGNVFRSRLKIDILDFGWTEYWIEGIGSTKGLLYSGFVQTGIAYELLCFFENNELVFHNQYFENCYYGITGFMNKINWKNELNIWPNPVIKSQKLFIEIPFHGYSDNNCFLIDPTGICIDNFRFNGSKYCYSLPSQLEGLYTIKILTKNIYYQSKLLIK